MFVSTATRRKPTALFIVALANILLVLSVMLFPAAVVQANSLKAIQAINLPDNTTQIQLTFDQDAITPSVFTIDHPARLVLDFPVTEIALPEKRKRVDEGPVRGFVALQTQERARIIVNLTELISYETQTKGSQLILTLAKAKPLPADPGTSSSSSASAAKRGTVPGLENVDFRRNASGAGLVIFQLADEKTPIDVTKVGSTVKLRLLQVDLPTQFDRKLDVTDFGTPVQTIDTVQRGDDIQVQIRVEGDYDHMVYQTDKQLTVEIQPFSQEELQQRQREEQTYHGQRLSLNFQDVEVRAVLQLIADFTDSNMVASDSVKGKVTLRLENVPWDQALAIILRSKGLAMRQTDNVIMVAPSAEIAAREQQELQASQQVSALAPLHSEFVQINYAKAADIAALLKGDSSSLLSSRGNVSTDVRTNTLLVQDTLEKLEEIRQIVRRLDTPVRQVEIEARIVTATKAFSRDIGIRWGGSGSVEDGKYRVGLGRDLSDAQLQAQQAGRNVSSESLLNVNLGLQNPSSQLAFSIAKLGALPFLDLELSAAQAEDLTNVIASPKLITANQREAVIKQGKQIPYLEASSSGATSVSFRDAVLELKVIPQITPNNNIIMDLTVTQDVVKTTSETVASDRLPIIDTKEIVTQVLIDNGETVVLGGVYEQTLNNDSKKVPFFSDLPLLGVLFKNQRKADTKNELLIFVTPTIVSSQLVN